jgi:hypothetical protein
MEQNKRIPRPPQAERGVSKRMEQEIHHVIIKEQYLYKKKQETYSKENRRYPKIKHGRPKRRDRRMPCIGIERRSEPRRTYHSPMNFSLKGQEDAILPGVVNDISMSGMGIYSFVPLSEGQVITVKNVLPGDHIRYVVRWSMQIVDDFYEAGLKMVQ